MSEFAAPPPDLPDVPATPTVLPKRQRTRRWMVGAVFLLAAALVIGGAAGGWWLANVTLIASQQNATPPGPTVTNAVASELQMPDVRGLDQATAEQVLADSGISVAAITIHDAPSAARPGAVVEQTPAFGASDVSKVELGVAVPVTMPDLAGKTQNAAVEILSGYGTGVDVTYGYSKDAIPGTVLSGDPAVGAPLGQTASILVSTAGSTLPLTQVNSITGGCSTNTNAAINGHDYATALSCSTDPAKSTDTSWMLSKTVDRFTATVGIADDGLPGTTAPYQVLIDGNVVAEGTAAFGTSSAVDVPCTNAIQLTVRIGSGSATHIAVVFGDAVVYGSDQGIARLAKF